MKRTIATNLFEFLASRLMERFWPGPLTVVVADRAAVEIGLRIPDHKFLVAVIRDFGKPLLSTSANRSGSKPLNDVSSPVTGLRFQPDFIVEETFSPSPPSTVIRLAGSTVELIRDGGISFSRIQAVL